MRRLTAAMILLCLASGPAIAGPPDAGAACGALFKDDVQKLAANGDGLHPHRWMVVTAGDKSVDVSLFVHKDEGWERHDGYRCRVGQHGELIGEAPNSGRKTWLDAPAKR
ncbi:MAG TPA: hypothetical protein HPQ04_10225 [Rhodospirillaceae bacterium]|nr:hypothetical protein [Rhodospirillaceae bacterium]